MMARERLERNLILCYSTSTLYVSLILSSFFLRNTASPKCSQMNWSCSCWTYSKFRLNHYFVLATIQWELIALSIICTSMYFKQTNYFLRELKHSPSNKLTSNYFSSRVWSIAPRVRSTCLAAESDLVKSLDGPCRPFFCLQRSTMTTPSWKMPKKLWLMRQESFLIT